MAEKTLVLRFKSEVTEAKGGIAELRKGITGIFEGVPGSLTSTFAGAGAALSGIQGVLNNILPALGTMTDTARAAIELANFAADRMELRERVSQETVDRLRASSAGLISTTNLMSLANQSAQGDFALTRGEMDTVTKAARVLAEEYRVNINDVLPQLLDSLQRGKAQGFGPFGIIIEDTTSKAQVFARGMEALTEKASHAGDVALSVGDKIQRLKIDMANAGDEAKSFFGDAAIGFGLLLGHADDYVRSFGGNIPQALREAKEETSGWNMALNIGTGILGDFRAAIQGAHGDVVEFKNELAHKTTRQIRALVTETMGFVDVVNKLDKSFDDLAKAQARAVKTSASEFKKQSDELERQERAAREAAMAWADFGVELRELADIPTTFFDSLRSFNADEGTIAGLAGVMDALTASIVDGPLAALGAMEEKLAGISEAVIPQWKQDLDALRVSADRFTEILAERGVTALESFGDAAGTAYGNILRGQGSVADNAMQVVEGLLLAEAIHAASLGVKWLIMSAGYAAMQQWGQATALATAAAGMLAWAAATGAAYAAVASGGGEGGASAAGGGARGNDDGRGLGTGSSQGPTMIEMNFNLGYGFVGDEKALGRALVPIVENAVASGAVRELRGASRRVRDHG